MALLKITDDVAYKRIKRLPNCNLKITKFQKVPENKSKNKIMEKHKTLKICIKKGVIKDIKIQIVVIFHH